MKGRTRRSEAKGIASGIPVYCAFDEIAPIDRLRPNPRNPNTHPDAQVALLAKIIKEQGWRAPITISRRSGLIVRGHCRLLAARALGLQEVPVDQQDYATDEEELADLVADNRVAELAIMDSNALKAVLDELERADIDLELAGFTEDALEELTAQCQEAGDIIEDEAPPVPGEAVTQPGDLWLLGRHRLLCGDCRRAEDVGRLFGGARADSIVTDPPYGVDYSDKNEFLNEFDKGNRIQTPIRNDAIADYRAFFAAFLGLAPLAEYNTAYVFMAGKELHSLRLALDDAGFTWSDYLVWVKNVHVLGRKDYNARHEFIVYGWKGKHRFYGGFGTTVLEFDKPARNELHPTQKPVPLVAQLVKDGTPPAGLVYDPFAGSGTTLVAAEQLGRACYSMEIEPTYCDVIVRRWEALTGQKAVREQCQGGPG